MRDLGVIVLALACTLLAWLLVAMALEGVISDLLRSLIVDFNNGIWDY